MPYELSDFKPGDRIELHPATDLWMRGARFGTVRKIGRKFVTIEIDALSRGPIRIRPENIGSINPDGPI
jgi:hypothetical protein